MKEKGIISPSKSPWASPIVIVFKKDGGSIHLCIDYCYVNEITSKDACPIPSVNDTLDTYLSWSKMVLHTRSQEWLLAGRSSWS